MGGLLHDCPPRLEIWGTRPPVLLSPLTTLLHGSANNTQPSANCSLMHESARRRILLVSRQQVATCHNNAYWGCVWQRNVVVLLVPANDINTILCRYRHMTWITTTSVAMSLSAYHSVASVTTLRPHVLNWDIVQIETKIFTHHGRNQMQKDKLNTKT